MFSRHSEAFHFIQSHSWCSHFDPNDTSQKRAWRRCIGIRRQVLNHTMFVTNCSLVLVAVGSYRRLPGSRTQGQGGRSGKTRTICGDQSILPWKDWHFRGSVVSTLVWGFRPSSSRCCLDVPSLRRETNVLGTCLCVDFSPSVGKTQNFVMKAAQHL